MSIRAIRKFPSLTPPLLALVLLAAGCGSDSETPPAASTDTPAAPTTPTTTPGTGTGTSAPDPSTETLPNDGNGNGTSSPESAPGGAGDETPAQTLALFTGSNGEIAPRVVRVPAFISIRVELRSRDGAEYSLTFGAKTVKVSHGLSSASTTFAGLRPGAKLVGTPAGGGAGVRVEATAEPGP